MKTQLLETRSSFEMQFGYIDTWRIDNEPIGITALKAKKHESVKRASKTRIISWCLNGVKYTKKIKSPLTENSLRHQVGVEFPDATGIKIKYGK